MEQQLYTGRLSGTWHKPEFLSYSFLVPFGHAVVLAGPVLSGDLCWQASRQSWAVVWPADVGMSSSCYYAIARKVSAENEVIIE